MFPAVFSMAQSEPATFCRRELFERLGGFDEGIGVGSSSPWQAAEGPDLVLTALEHGSVCYYDPSLYGFHREYDLDDPAGGDVNKGTQLCSRHGLRPPAASIWPFKPVSLGFPAALHCF